MSPYNMNIYVYPYYMYYVAMAKKINIYQIPWVLKIDQMNNSGETTRKKDQKNKYDNKRYEGRLILKNI